MTTTQQIHPAVEAEIIAAVEATTDFDTAFAAAYKVAFRAGMISRKARYHASRIAMAIYAERESGLDNNYDV